MPWKENRVFDLRKEFIDLYLADTMSVADLSREFKISRPTAYKFIQRYEKFGDKGLHDLPRVPCTHPNATPEEMVSFIVSLRTKHPNWGARKLKAILERDYPLTAWPAESTIGLILKQNGLAARRRRRSPVPGGRSVPLTQAEAPCSVWAADFKGQFLLGTGQWCYPLTITDSYSRMILKCHGLPKTSYDAVLPIWVAAFKEHGLPCVIRTDNGAPFASSGLGGLSKLSIWWLKLGVIPERIAPASPQENGRHEQMHRVLKKETTKPSETDFKQQQITFDKFVEEYNNIRPHEGIGMATPASLYAPSSRRYPLRAPKIEYPSRMQVRHVRTNGYIRWKNGMLFVSEVLTGEHVGLDQIHDGIYALFFGPMPLAILDEHIGGWLSPKKAALIIKELKEESLHQITKV